MELGLPYFLENKDWYYEVVTNKETGTTKCYLTDLGKSMPEVVKSYNEYYDIGNTYDPVFFNQAMKDAEKLFRAKLKAKGLSQIEIDKKVKEWREG